MTQTIVAQTITFGSGGNAAEFQRGGWNGPEGTFNWTDGHRSELEFDAPDAPFGFYIEIDAGCLLQWPERPSQPVVVCINNERVAVLDIHQEGALSIFCPAPKERRINLSFDMPGAIRMSDIRDGGDPRSLALAVRRMRIMPLLEPRVAASGERLRVIISGHTAAEAASNAERATGLSIHELLTRFEMLCGDCWFGLAQRVLGSEPLGLLRFAGASPSVAIRSLETDFSGVGDDISPSPSPHGADEWMIADAVGLNYHSGKPLSVARDEVIAAEKKKITFLRRKILRELAEADKIFLFADCSGRLPEAAMSIFLALRRVSGAHMLWVRPTPHGEPHGSVREIAAGLFMGFMDFRGAPMVADIPIGGWLSVLASAALLADRSHEITSPRPPECQLSGVLP